MNQINILKNGEQFARTIPPFCEEDAQNVATIIRHLQSGSWVVGNGVLQIVNSGMGDELLMDMINFNGQVDQVSYIMAHLSAIQIPPSKDEWSFVEESTPSAAPSAPAETPAQV